MISTTVAWSSH